MIPTSPNPAGPVLENLLGQIQSLELIDQPTQSHGRWFSHLLQINLRGSEPVLLPIKIPFGFLEEDLESDESEAEE